jgi:hypothetical protein
MRARGREKVRHLIFRSGRISPTLTIHFLKRAKEDLLESLFYSVTFMYNVVMINPTLQTGENKIGR